MKTTLTFTLTRPARKSGGDRYETGMSGERFVIYIPQEISRSDGNPVEEITIAGNFDRMLADVDAVGDELVWLGSVAAPALRIAHLTVAGQ